MQWLMLQQDEPEDFVISTGRTETVRKFIEICAVKLNWNTQENKPGIIWEGEGINELGRRADTNDIVIKIDKRYFDSLKFKVFKISAISGASRRSQIFNTCLSFFFLRFNFSSSRNGFVNSKFILKQSVS